MNSNIAVINQVIVLFLIMGVGAIARKIDILNVELRKGITGIILNITFPFLVIGSFNQSFSTEMLFNMGSIFIYSLVIHTALIIISKFLYNKYSDDISRILRYSTIFSNCGFMGYPVVEALFGKIGIFYAAIYSIPYNIFMWSVGIALFSKSKKQNAFKDIILNPGIVATFIGLALFLLPIKLPYPVAKAADMIGSMTTPLSMLVIGSMLAEVRFKEMFSGFPVFYLTAVRLIILPLLVLIILKAFRVSGILLGICVVITAMPAASVTAIIAERYNGNVAFASQCVFITTLLSMITIPLIIMLL